MGGVLTVYLDKMMNLRDADWIGKSDPYVKFQVEQDNWVLDKDYGHQKSTVKRDTCNPQYGEVFTWTLPSLKNMVIHCKVMDKDPLVDDKLGYCKVKLEDLGLSEVPLGIDRVVDNNWFTKDGKIFLQISWTQ